MGVARGAVPNWLRLPLEGRLDLTYRCNNHCRHCWLQLPEDSPRRAEELSLDEIRRIADESRALGCRKWGLSGGEPMLRPDFAEILACLTAHSASYTLNTNGTLITPEIARLMVRKGAKMVALYGATAELHDHITRNPGSFEATMRGFAYLKEAGAGFVVQIVPMRDNWHQYRNMVRLAQSLSPHYRVGAAWLNMASPSLAERNTEIARQRLDPRDVVELDPPDMSGLAEASASCGHGQGGDDRLFASCILRRDEFHIDAYGGMSFCPYIKDPAMRFDLRKGDVREAWEVFLPSLADRVRGGQEYLRGCGACEIREDCRWCGAYAYLEHGHAASKVEYLCQVARASRTFRKDWKRQHRRYFQIAGVTIQMDSDIPIGDGTFAPKLAAFSVSGPGNDTISLHHHFGLPNLDGRDLGKEIYRKPPWAIFRRGGSWIYHSIDPDPEERQLYRIAEFNHDHSRGRIYSPSEEQFRKGGLASLTMFPTDQALLARVLADRQACYLHSAAVVIDAAGLVFVGHSEAGKSTTVKLLEGRSTILCDDRNIVRRWPDGFRVHGTWSHGEVPLVSSASAPLAAILLLAKSTENRLVRLTDRKQILAALLGCVIKPVVDAGWWEKILDLLAALAREVPCYEMRFDKSGAIVPALLELARAGRSEDAASNLAPQKAV